MRIEIETFLQSLTTDQMDTLTLLVADIRKCRFFIMDPDHYWSSGACRCNDAAHRHMMITEWGYSPEDFAGIPLLPAE
jgi:hypothetical protein